ncbi:hypothetical protein NQ317_001851 [Molorchus minor]|uniref:Nuclear-export cofactor Arc1-like N-terminal domain-containing protein n=1 Tax=Molorchus minor TaxID=1323400 RepID=A0ABQ9K0I7_9CUCU|nr:hypothetical protein NQ317_001851 [Molorchus minor]
MVANLQYLQNLSSYLKVKIEKPRYNEDSLCTCIVNGKIISGLSNIIAALLTESKSNLSGITSLENAEIQQWVEYGIVYVTHIYNNSQNLSLILKELNGILSRKTYLVSHKLTIADVLLYYILLNAMVSLPILEKEKYINVSRWFDNLQQENSLRQSKSFINFSTNYLISVAPARH